MTILKYATFDGEFGRFLVVRGEHGLTSVTFSKELDVERELTHLRSRGHVLAVEDRITLRRVVDDIRDYLGGRNVTFDHELDLGCSSDFSRRVLEVVRRIPYGSLRSYKWVAGEAGAPRATRPVGQTLSRNPLPIIIPCHRVVNSDGTLGGYSGGGTDMKRRLIEIENGQIGLAFARGEDEAKREVIFRLEADALDGDNDN
ncbi:methylated-DNA--[protein]-cysteine S-methyltransferase [bacterium]|nr:methylated-DNA--[protein]-cysteine S-methyltransferase [bacterium]